MGPLNSSYETTRDYDGHGTHTLSTAEDNFIKGVSIFGNGYGIAKGVPLKPLLLPIKYVGLPWGAVSVLWPIF